MMQVTKKTKYILIISIFLLIFSSVSAQDNVDNSTNSDTLVTQNDTISVKHKFSFSNLFKRHKKEKKQTEDTLSQKKKFSFKNLFRHKNKNDSTLMQSDSLSDDSLTGKTRLKNDSLNNSGKNKKPQRISPGIWLKLNAEQQDSLLRAWDDYDRNHYVKKYTNSPRVKKIDMKRDKTFIDKLILKFSGNMSYKYRKKLINRRISRYRKTMIYDRLKKSDTSPDDTISDIKRYKTVNKQFKLQAKQEAVRKNKVILKYDRKEQRLRRRYSLTDNEQIILNKGKGMRLSGIEKMIFKKARSKQEKFTEKLLRLRKKRSYALQNKEVKKRIKKDQKRITKRDRIQNKKLHKNKRDKEGNKKHDSSEYPKRWFR